MAMTALAYEAQAEVTVEVMAGHWGHHWISDDVTNEKHALGCLRVSRAIGCRFNNSYKGTGGFSGETYALGYTREWTLADDLNRHGGAITVMGAVGVTYGYTEFGGHTPGGNKKVLPFVAPALFYRQPMTPGSYWKAGILQFGDDSVLTGAVGVTF